jgi:peptide/nickel transport system substrate-binding protein
MIYGNVQPENLTTVFADPSTPNPDFQGRAVSTFDPYVQYLWIDITEIPNVKHRQALAAALDRDGMITNSGGAFAGTVADGVVKPNLPADYAPTGLWDTLLGGAVPATGNPELAMQLIHDAGEPMPEITYDYPQTPVRDQEAAIIISSLQRAGIEVTANPIPPGQYYGIIFNDDQANEMGWGGWGPDWPNASTIIAPLFTPNGGWNLSRVSDQAWIERVQEALREGDRNAQATMWQELNTEAAENVFVIPTIFGLTQVVAGKKVQPAYQWAPYGSWPYGEMYVTE